MKNTTLWLASFAVVLGSIAIGMSSVLFYLRSQNQTQTALVPSPLITQQPNTFLEKTVQELGNRLTSLEASMSAFQASLSQTSKNKTAPATSTTIIKKSTTPNDTSLFLGSGQTNNRDWTTLTSAAGDVDLRSYLDIKEVRFEAGVSIIGGEAHVRLIDLTTGQPIYASEIYGNTDPGQWISSGPLNLPAEKHNYAVQLRSSSGEMANLIGARLRIVSK